MKKTVYTALGFASSIRYKQGSTEWELAFNKQMSWKRNRRVFVMLARDTTEILIVEWNSKKTAIPRRAQKQKQLVKSWNSWDVSNAWEIPILNKTMCGSGRITRIEYTSDKFDRPTDKRGRFHLYRHDFVNVVPFSVSVDEDMFKFKHPRLLSSRGIIA